MAQKHSFSENLEKISDSEQPFSTGALYALSNMEPENQAQFEKAWPGIDLERRRRTVTALTELAEDDIELNFSSALLFMVGDSDPQVRGKAIEGLWEDESREVLARLLTTLSSDPDDTVREKAALGLSRFAYRAELGRLTERWVNRLREALLAQCGEQMKSVHIGRRAIEALGYFGNDEQIIRLIQQAYESDDELLRASALKAMGRSINKRWLPEVGQSMSNSDPSLRYEAATAAGEMGSEELLLPLLTLTKDPDQEVQLAAIWALGQVGGQEAGRALKQIAGSENETLAQAAQDALAEVSFASNPLNVLRND
ncbi:MAG TPA: HEAT repeat domain-containing protein [Chloroflexia bacterium]|nr:HEAT repeat domain-containing protein [Chloroflexia bacterium]